MIKFSGSLFLLLFLALQLKAQVVNVESSRLNNDSSAFVNVGGFNFTYLQQANSVANLGANWTSQLRKKNAQILFLSNTNLVQAEKTIYDRSVTSHLRFTYRINNLFKSESFVQYQFNQVYGLQSRFLLGQGVRIKLFKKSNFRMYYGIAAMYEWEKPLNDIHFSSWNNNLRCSNYISFTFSTNNLDFNGTTYYQPVLTRFGNYRLSTQYALSFKINKHFSWKNEWSLMYFSMPYTGVDAFNSRFMSGLEIGF